MRKTLNKMESVANWSDLPHDMLVEIAIKLKDFKDFTACRGVCKSWRSAAARNIFFKGAPLLMLPENKNNESHEREFYSLLRREIFKARVPEAKGKRCLDARFGWIVAVAPEGDEVCLFKPFSSSPTIPLPNSHNFPKYHEEHGDPEVMCVKKAILTANPSETSDFMVFVLINYALGFWRSGDENWTMIESEFPNDFTNIGYCSNKMYAMDCDYRLWIWDHPTQLQLLLKLDLLSSSGVTPYMMESTAGELVIRRDYTDSEYERATEFAVIRLDVVKREWEETNDIGKDVIFLGGSAAVSIPMDGFLGVIKPNSIYFIDDGEGHPYPYNILGVGNDLRIYNFENKSIERFNIESYPCFRNPPFWVFP